MNQVVAIPNRAVSAAHVTFAEMERLAEKMAASKLFGIKDKDAMLALMAVAHAEGRHPALAARDYDIIQGRPAKKAEAMLRDFIEGGGRVEWHALDDTIADATFSHPAGGSARITWDHKRVATAQINNSAMYKKYPRQMLRSRCVSEGVRTVCPAATSGMYVPEEVADFDAPRPTPAATPQVIEAKPVAAPTLIEPPVHPETGEVSPHQIPRGGTAPEWGAKMIAAIKAATSVEEVTQWMAVNADALDQMEKSAPKTYAMIEKAERDRIVALAKPSAAQIAAAELSGEAPPL